MMMINRKYRHEKEKRWISNKFYMIYLSDDLRMEFIVLLKRNDARGSAYIICIIWPISHK